jgi:hypothetical protein
LNRVRAFCGLSDENDCYLGAPNFRPSFRFFNRWTALLGIEQRVVVDGGISSNPVPTGTLGNIGVMFYLSWLYGIIATAILLAVFIYLVVTAPARDWGEISQAIMFHQVGHVGLWFMYACLTALVCAGAQVSVAIGHQQAAQQVLAPQHPACGR